MKLYFDLTTSLCWGGFPVGITRVEREIAKRAAGRSATTVAYCFYHAPSQQFYEMSAWLAEGVLSGRCHLNRDDLLAADFSNLASSANLGRIFSKTSGRSASDARVLATAARHVAVSNMSLTDILRSRDSLSVVPIHWGSQRRLTPTADLIRRKVPLGGDTWIINAGLDWDHKDLRDIRIAKQKKNFKYVAIIYDLIPLLYPHFVVPSYVDVLKRYFGELFWTADYALCISETTKHDVETHMAEWRMPSLPMDSWQLGSDISSGPSGAPQIDARLRESKYLLYVSTIEPRKSHRTIVEAFDYLVRHNQIEEDVLCVFVGRSGWNIDNLLQEIRTNPAIRDRIVILSDISDAELGALYEAARFIVFPSRYEGYGLSLVEAMALGKACISSNAGSLSEVGGDAPLYIPPHDIQAWAEAIRDFMKDDHLVESYQKRSRDHYSPVTWDLSADQFYTRLNAAMGVSK